MNNKLTELIETLRMSVHAADPTQQDVVIVDLYKQVENIQSNIAKLEARNKELESLVKDLLPVAKDGYKLHIKNACHQEFLEEDRELLSKAEQALNKPK